MSLDKLERSHLFEGWGKRSSLTVKIAFLGIPWCRFVKLSNLHRVGTLHLNAQDTRHQTRDTRHQTQDADTYPQDTDIDADTRHKTQTLTRKTQTQTQTKTQTHLTHRHTHTHPYALRSKHMSWHGYRSSWPRSLATVAAHFPHLQLEHRNFVVQV